MKNKPNLNVVFVVALGLMVAFSAQAGKYPREPEKCGKVCERKAVEAKQNREDRWDAYVAKAATAAPYTPLAATYQNKILPGMIAAYQEKYAKDIDIAQNMMPFGDLARLCAENPGNETCEPGGTYANLSERIVKNIGVNALGDAYIIIGDVKWSIKSLGTLNTMGLNNVPVIYNNGRFCTGWLGCAINIRGGGGGSSGGDGSNNPIIIPPGFTPPPGWSSLPSFSPSPPPTEASITKFEITNFRLQTALNGVDYYQVLKEQMAIDHENYQLNLAWGVSGASSCQASCKYVKIDDYLQNQNWDDLQAQPWPCSSNIDNQTTFAGDVDKEYGSAKTKPKENGIIRYTLSCQGETGNDRKDLLVVIQAFQWFESIPILNQ